MADEDTVHQLELMQARVTFVPQGWRFSKVGETFRIRNNLRQPISQEERAKNPGPYPYYGPTRIQDYIGSYFQNGAYALIGEDGDHFLKYRVQKMTQLVDGKCTVNNHAHVIEGTTSSTREWFYYYFMHRDIFSFLTRQGAGRFKLNKEALEKIPLLVPPVKEQGKIVQILSTWDEAIATTEQLLANSEQQKKALMQQLLKGKKRLPRFEGEWQQLSLGELGDVSSAGVDKKSNRKEKTVRLLNYLDVFRREFIFDQELNHEVTAPDKKIESCNVKNGDIFFTPSSETRDELAFSAVAAETMPGVVYSYHVVRLRPKVKLDLNFSAYLFQTPVFSRQAYKAGDGSGQRYVISQKSFRKMEVLVPPIAEQEAIGKVLRSASDKIQALRKEIDFLREEKKALMQQLLSGKRRVNVDKAERATA